MASRFRSSLFVLCILSVLLFSMSMSMAGEVHAQTESKIPLQAPTTGHKSGFLAVILSLAVPGLGEAYSGRFDAGKYLTSAEIGLWGGYAGLSVYTADFQNDMENSAIINAGASANHHGDQNYFAHVGQYLTSDLYNQATLRQGQPSQLVSKADGWRWASQTDLQNFNAVRVKVQTLDNDRQFMLAAVVLNHLISAIDAFIVTRKLNAAISSGTGALQGAHIEFGGHIGALYDPKGASLCARVTF